MARFWRPITSEQSTSKYIRPILAVDWTLQKTSSVSLNSFQETIGVKMASLIPHRTVARTFLRSPIRSNILRTLSTTSQAPIASTSAQGSTTESTSTQSATVAHPEGQEDAPITHFKITLRRSAISLGDKIKGTLKALGIHRRFQTVYFPHSPEVAGKILRVKELVEVENVPTHLVRTKQQQRQERKAPRGYKVVGTKRGKFMNV